MVLIITNKKVVKNFAFGIDKQKMMLYDKNVSKKVNTKSPSLNSELNDRLTRKGIPSTSNEFLMPNKALLCLLDIFVSS